MFDIDHHEKEILAVGYKNKTIETKEKRNQINLIDIKYMLGTNHLLPLSHMAKNYICLEETNQRINEFSIGYMLNLNLSIDKAFKEQIKICMKTTFGRMTQQHSSKILSKTNTIVLALVMFYETRQRKQRKFSKC